MLYTQNLDPNTKSKLIIKLYRNVKNIPEIRQMILNGTLHCSVVKPSLVVDPFQLVVAANKAICAQKLKTKSIYSEILFNLSTSKNITQSLQTFGIHDKESDILVAVIIRDVDESDKVFKQIDGDEVELSELAKLFDEKAICKAYKINDPERRCTELIDSIVTRIAVKDCLL